MPMQVGSLLTEIISTNIPQGGEYSHRALASAASFSTPTILDQWRGRTDGSLQMNRLSLTNNWLKFKISRKLRIILEEYVEYTSIQ
jgi:hypothetical protein